MISVQLSKIYMQVDEDLLLPTLVVTRTEHSVKKKVTKKI